MTCEEIFSTLINHMVKGLMVHEQLSNYYDFLGLPSYSKCHDKHYKKESKSYRKMYHYYITAYNKLLPEMRFDQPQVIPASWVQYTRQQVDDSTKQNAVKTGLETWVSWEKDTLKLYQNLYKELFTLGEIASANKINELICDVQGEIAEAEQYHLNKVAVGYDIVYIIEEQDKNV